MIASNQPYPFLFFNHEDSRKYSRIQGERQLIIWFTDSFSVSHKNLIMRTNPFFFQNNFHWGSHQLSIYCNFNEELIISHYKSQTIYWNNQDIRERCLNQFFLDVENWLLYLHNQGLRILFTIGFDCNEGSKWHRWSLKFIDTLESYLTSLQTNHLSDDSRNILAFTNVSIKIIKQRYLEQV